MNLLNEKWKIDDEVKNIEQIIDNLFLISQLERIKITKEDIELFKAIIISKQY